jgi:hypothetical protein
MFNDEAERYDQGHPEMAAPSAAAAIGEDELGSAMIERDMDEPALLVEEDAMDLDA